MEDDGKMRRMDNGAIYTAVVDHTRDKSEEHISDKEDGMKICFISNFQISKIFNLIIKSKTFAGLFTQYQVCHYKELYI